jgi:hypothetical protein
MPNAIRRPGQRQCQRIKHCRFSGAIYANEYVQPLIKGEWQVHRATKACQFQCINFHVLVSCHDCRSIVE